MRVFGTALAVLITAAMPFASVARAGEAGDAVFAERGPWSLADETLVWKMSVDGPAAQGFRPVDDGSVTMAQITDPSDGQPALQLTVATDGRTRKIGPFPIQSGDPSLTYFLESTANDVARLTGGSPFYIRNRMKDALFRGGKLVRENDTVTASFKPFEGDENAARMVGFDGLTLTFVIGGPKLPIREMLAETPGETPGYRSHLVLQ